MHKELGLAALRGDATVVLSPTLITLGNHTSIGQPQKLPDSWTPARLDHLQQSGCDQCMLGGSWKGQGLQLDVNHMHNRVKACEEAP